MIQFKRSIEVLLAATLLLLIGGADISFAAPPPGVRADKVDFSVQDLDGREVRLSDFRGKVVLLNFWASWCYPCRYEMSRFEKIYRSLSEKGLVVLAVGVDETVNPIKNFQKKYGFSFPVVFDRSGEARKVFKLSSVPETFLVNREGKLMPLRDPKTSGLVSMINDPTAWEHPEIIEFLKEVLGG